MNNSHSGASCMVPLEELNDKSSSYLVNDIIAVGGKIIQVEMLPCSLVSTNFIQNNKSSGSYSWDIEDFSKLNRPMDVSKPFQIAGHTWTLSVHPEGDRDKNYVSLYLNLYNFKSQLPSSNGVIIHGALSIKNQSGESYSRNIGINFNSNTGGWGFSQFMKLERFKDPSKGYLIKGTCTIEVSVCIIGSSVGHKSNVVRRNVRQ